MSVSRRVVQKERTYTTNSEYVGTHGIHPNKLSNVQPIFLVYSGEYKSMYSILICSIFAVQKLNAGFDVKPDCSERSVKASLLFQNGKQKKQTNPKMRTTLWTAKLGTVFFCLTKQQPKKKHVSLVSVHYCSKKSTICQPFCKRNIATIDLQFVRLLGGHLPCQRMWLGNNTCSSPLGQKKWDEFRRRLSIPSGKLT